MKFSTFHAFMLADAKVGGAVTEGPGFNTSPAKAIADELELIEYADELGYDTCWVREHHFTQYGFLPNTMSLLAHAAARTERIRLGTAVVTLPLHHPIRAAEDTALIDVLSGGRLALGVGRGYQSIEFNAFGIPLSEARARTDESIEIMKRLWTTEGPVDFEGRFFQFSGIELQPKPLQRPHPPIHYASISPESIVHYGKMGIPFIVDPTGTTGSIARLAETWRQAAVEFGHSPHGDLVACRYVWLAPTDTEARTYVNSAPPVTSLSVDPNLTPRNRDGSVAKGYEYWERGWHGRTVDHYAADADWDDRWIAGDVERVVSGIRALERMGYANLCVIFGLDASPPPVPEIKRRMALFAREVMPAFEPGGGGGGLAAVTDLPPSDDTPEARYLIEQLQADLGGEVVAVRRQARWRPAWFVDLRRDGQLQELYVRGARTDMRPIFPLAHERRMQELLDALGIPVPQVRGYLSDPPAIVMDRVHGNTEFTGSSDAERRSVMDEYIQILARMHHLDVGAFAEAGAELPARPSDAALTGIRAYERAYRMEKVRPDPFMEFCLGWLARNPPRHRVRPSVVVWDSGQFLHREGRISALLDLELAHIGDPMMDLAGLRMRSTVIDYGPLDELYRRYEDLTGDEVDLEAIAYQHFAFTITTQLAYHRGLVEPTSDSDLMTYMQWCSESNLYAVEALAGFVGIELEKVELPQPSPSPSAVAHRHLVDSIRAMAGRDEQSAYQLRIAFRLARHLQRVDAIGASLTECDLDDVADVIGHRPSTWVESERELERFVIGTDPQSDGALIRLFHRRLERQRALLGPEGSAMTRHNPLQPIRAPSG